MINFHHADAEALMTQRHINTQYYSLNVRPTNNLGYFYRATACNATHGIAKAFLPVHLSVCPSVRLFIKRVHCHKTKEMCAYVNCYTI